MSKTSYTRKHAQASQIMHDLGEGWSANMSEIDNAWTFEVIKGRTTIRPLGEYFAADIRIGPHFHGTEVTALAALVTAMEQMDKYIVKLSMQKAELLG